MMLRTVCIAAAGVYCCDPGGGSEIADVDVNANSASK